MSTTTTKDTHRRISLTQLSQGRNIDLWALHDDGLVLFQDKNLQRVTSVDKGIQYVTLKESLGIPVLVHIDGKVQFDG